MNGRDIAPVVGSALRPRHPVLLIVIDGWGLAPPGPANAIELARPAAIQRLAQEFASTSLEASGPAVGLPEGQMGNSEVGHLNIGAGRVVDQDIVRITKTIRQGQLDRVAAFADLIEYCRTGGRALHLVGLLGPGGVHSHEEHLFGLLEAARRGGVARTWVHHVLDGRDTPPQSALEFAHRAQPHVDAATGARVATVSGRYWTMDRDKRWERTARAYRMLVHLEGHRAPTAAAAIEAAYARGETDEFVAPTVVGTPDPIRPGDAALFYNFRPDRMRQLVRALNDPAFREFPTESLGLRAVSLTLYDRTFDALGVRIAFRPDHPDDTLGAYYARLGLRQLRVAETEKYAHVTYFFSGGREDPFAGEERLLLPSPKVATYDLQPEMSAFPVTDELLPRLDRAEYDLVVLNLANPDMVGHTGLLAPTVRACEVVDECIGRLVEAARKRDYVVAITADHGNAELMADAQGGPVTAHTTNPVPVVLVHDELKGLPLERGRGLSSLAPTLLGLLGLPVPAQMTGPPLGAPGRAEKGPNANRQPVKPPPRFPP